MMIFWDWWVHAEGFLYDRIQKTELPVEIIEWWVAFYSHFVSKILLKTRVDTKFI
jgi:hypothetical protein